MEQGPLGLNPELRTPPLPATHVRVGTDHRVLARNYTTDQGRPSYLRVHSLRATSCRNCCLVLFLLPPQCCGRRYRGLPSHVPCSSRRPGSRRLHAGHPLASKRAPARLLPGQGVRPGFDVTYWLSTLQQRFTCVRLPDPHLTPEGAFSSSLTTHGIQPTQHEAV